MRRPLLRLGVAGSLLVAAAVTLSASPASAGVPAPVTATQTAARDYGNGGLATSALVHAGAMAQAADGAILFFDTEAHQIRRVDPSTGDISAIVGIGGATPTTQSTRCNFTTSLPARSTWVDGVTAIWPASNGDLYVRLGHGIGSPCYYYVTDVYRIDHTDGSWHQVLDNTWGHWGAVTVTPAGQIYASDTYHHVIRTWPAGTDAVWPGTVVAGVTDSAGYSGDGGPATSAQIADPDSIAAETDGALLLTGYARIRRVDPTTGDIDTVAGTGTAPPYGQQTVDDGNLATNTRLTPGAMTVGGDGTVYFEDRTGPDYSERAFSVGGVTRTVIGPAGDGSLATPGICIGDHPLATTVGASELLTSCNGPVRSWPTDGSAALSPGTKVAGLDDFGAAAFTSPDGTPLSSAFIGYTNGIAAAPDGRFALATPLGIRTLSGLQQDSTISTLSTLRANALRYAPDGTLYAYVGRGTPDSPYAVDTIASNGTATTVVGGGSAALTDGATGTSVTLSQLGSIAVDAGNGKLWFDTGNDLWSLDTSDGTVHRSNAVVSGIGDLAVDPATHAIYALTGSHSLERIDVDDSVHDLGCAWTCDHGLQVAADGTIYVGGWQQGVSVLHPGGGTARALQGMSEIFTLQADGSLVGVPNSPDVSTSDGGGLLVSAPSMASVGFTDDAATISATAEPAAVHLTVTPPATAGETVMIIGSELPAAPVYPYYSGVALTSFITDGSTTPHMFDFSRLKPAGSSTGAALLAGHTYRFTAITTESAGAVSVDSAPAVATAEPLVDTGAPASPVLSVHGPAGYLGWQMTLPSDPDLDKVVLRYVAGPTPPASPSDGVGTDYSGGYQPGQQVSDFTWVDPTKAWSMAAWAYDTSGNVSAVATATLPAATLTAGDPVPPVGYQWANGTATIVYGNYFIAAVRYAAGTTVPATPADGTDAGEMGGAWGNFSDIPVAAGAQVAVSLFQYTNDAVPHFQRTSFVLTGGQSSDKVTVSAPSSITYGSKPSISATLIRHSADGHTVALSNQLALLYTRPHGTSQSYTYLAGSYTDANGLATFSVPSAWTKATDVEIRSMGINQVTLRADASVLMRSSVTASLVSSTVRKGRTATVKGQLSPKLGLNYVVERYVSGHWKVLGSTHAGSTGAYRFSFAPGTRGTWSLRVRIPAQTNKTVGAVTSSTSKTLKLKVS